MKNRKTKNRTIPNCLRKYRKVRGLNQTQAAKILGLQSTSMISRWEKGQNLPSFKNALRLGALYRIMVEGLYIDLAHEMKEDVLKREEKITQPR